MINNATTLTATLACDVDSLDRALADSPRCVYDDSSVDWTVEIEQDDDAHHAGAWCFGIGEATIEVDDVVIGTLRAPLYYGSSRTSTGVVGIEVSLDETSEHAVLTLTDGTEIRASALARTIRWAAPDEASDEDDAGGWAIVDEDKIVCRYASQDGARLALSDRREPHYSGARGNCLEATVERIADRTTTIEVAVDLAGDVVVVDDSYDDDELIARSTIEVCTLLGVPEVGDVIDLEDGDTEPRLRAHVYARWVAGAVLVESKCGDCARLHCVG